MKSKILSTLLITAFIFVIALTACGRRNNNGDTDVTVYYEGPWDYYDDTEGTGVFTGHIPAEGEWTFLRFPVGHVVYDDRVYAVEVNQSLSWGVDTYTGEAFLMDHFVAGKETAVFIQFNVPAWELTDYGCLIFVSIYHNGNFIAQLDWIDVDPFDENTLWFQPRAMADVGNWEAGEYEFVVLINDEIAAHRTTTFHQSRPMRVLTVPIIANYGGRIVYPTGEWQFAADMIHGTFPVARSDVEIIFAPVLDLRDARYDLYTDEGTFNVWQALANMQTRCNRYNAIKGYLPEMIAVDGGVMQGFTFGAPAAISTENDPQLLSTVIHEIAHFYYIGDEYPDGSGNFRINVPPYGMPVRDWYNRDVTVYGYRDSIWGGQDIDPELGTGSIISASQRPFYVEGRRFLGEVTSYMGVGGPQDPWATWVTSDIWIHLFHVFTGATGGTGPTPQVLASGTPEIAMGGASFGGLRCTECHSDIGEFNQLLIYLNCPHSGNWIPMDYDHPYDSVFCDACNHYVGVYEQYLFVHSVCGADIWFPAFMDFNAPAQGIAMRGMTPPTVMAVEFRGTMTGSGVFTPLPWFTFEADITDLDTLRDGEFTVHFLCSDENELSVSAFNLQFFTPVRTLEGHRDMPAYSVPVSFLFEFPVDTAVITVARNGTEIYYVVLSETEPEVWFTNMDYDQNLGERFTLTWEATGERDLFFEIWYSPTDYVFYNIATDITGNSFTVDLSQLPGSSEGFFYIYASDGVRTGSAYSPWIIVPYKAPAILTDLSVIPRFTITEEFILDVDIFDMQDGFLWCVEEVVWTLDGRHFISGSGLWIWPFELIPGYHTFALEAFNSAGLSVYGTFTVYVIDDDSAIPNDWSRDDIILGLSQGFVVDLRRLDTPITRGRFASFMTNVFFTMQEAEDYWDFWIPEYQEGIIEDGGQNSYDFWLMVYLGVMDAPGGRFNPNATITELEAALIMYRVAALADPQWFWDDATDQEIIDWLFEIEALEDTGPNILQESETLTNRMALVRLARFYNAVFYFG